MSNELPIWCNMDFRLFTANSSLATFRDSLLFDYSLTMSRTQIISGHNKRQSENAENTEENLGASSGVSQTQTKQTAAMKLQSHIE